MLGTSHSPPSVSRRHIRRRLRSLARGVALSGLAASHAYALPSGGVVSEGTASIVHSGANTTITQSSQRAVLDWQTFNVDAHESVNFLQASASSIALNRIHDANPSVILGSLTANGQVWLINPSGVVFGQNAAVDVGGMVATTANISNDRFMAGDFRFESSGRPDAAIMNYGTINASEAGLVALVAPGVINEGVITAKLGKIQLSSGDTFVLDPYGDGLINLKVSDAVSTQLVHNGGVLAAQGGAIQMTSAAGAQVVDSLINNSGIVSATSIGTRNGEIYLYAEDGTTVNSGAIIASGRNAGERGGRITVTGRNVALLDGTFIDASGSDGVSGTTAGKEVSAHREGSAGGDIRIGGDYLGQYYEGWGDTPTADHLYVSSGALILNDALNSGDAGRTIFWSNDTTGFYGNVYARALGGMQVDANTWNATQGGNAGDGGFVETSGYKHLDAGGYVDLTASSGNRGTYFLDPTDITIYGNFAPNFVSTDGSINLATNLKLWLDASDTANVNLTYNSLGITATGTSGTNTITVSANTGLTIGARIRLGGAGSVTAADTVGADTYTITAIVGTTITLSSNLTTGYAGSAVYQGYVSQINDKSGTGNNLTQSVTANMPLWISNGLNGQGLIRFAFNQVLNNSGANFANAGIAESTFVTFNSTATGTDQRVFYTPNGINLAGRANNLFSVVHDFVAHGPNSAITVGDGTYYNMNIITTSGKASSLYASGNSTVLSTNNSNISAQNYYQLGQTFFTGNIAEMFDYFSTITAGTTAWNLLNQYQSAKWGIALTPPGTGATEVAKATASDGYSVFTTRYLERLSQSADISLQATNDINLDLKTDTLNFSTLGRSLTLTAGNQITTASAGAIITNGGDITLSATNGIVLNHAIELTTNGGNLTLGNNTTLGANQSWNAGSGTMTFSGTVNGANSLTASAGTFGFAQALGGTTPLNAVSLTSTNGLTLPSISAASIFARTTGAAGDITLNGMLTASGAGNAIVLASGDDFINNAGAAALSAPAGRWLIYSTSPEGTLGEESLASDFTYYNCTYGGVCRSLGSGNGVLFKVNSIESDTVSDVLIADSFPARIREIALSYVSTPGSVMTQSLHKAERGITLSLSPLNLTISPLLNIDATYSLKPEAGGMRSDMLDQYGFYSAAMNFEDEGKTFRILIDPEVQRSHRLPAAI